MWTIKSVSRRCHKLNVLSAMLPYCTARQLKATNSILLLSGMLRHGAAAVTPWSLTVSRPGPTKIYVPRLLASWFADVPIMGWREEDRKLESQFRRERLAAHRKCSSESFQYKNAPKATTVVVVQV